MERLTEYWNGQYIADIYEDEADENGYFQLSNHNVQNLVNKLAEYEDKQEQGLLIELPCKMNDEFFVIAYSSRKVTHVRCTGYCVQEDGQTGRKEAFVWIDSLENNRDYWKLSLDDFKTQCFATEAEAEEALARMKGE